MNHQFYIVSGNEKIFNIDHSVRWFSAVISDCTITGIFIVANKKTLSLFLRAVLPVHKVIFAIFFSPILTFLAINGKNIAIVCISICDVDITAVGAYARALLLVNAASSLK